MLIFIVAGDISFNVYAEGYSAHQEKAPSKMRFSEEEDKRLN